MLRSFLKTVTYRVTVERHIWACFRLAIPSVPYNGFDSTNEVVHRSTIFGPAPSTPSTRPCFLKNWPFGPFTRHCVIYGSNVQCAKFTVSSSPYLHTLPIILFFVQDKTSIFPGLHATWLQRLQPCHTLVLKFKFVAPRSQQNAHPQTLCTKTPSSGETTWSVWASHDCSTGASSGLWAIQYIGWRWKLRVALI